MKRFAWEAYPQRVRAVSIGGDLEGVEKHIQGPPAFHSSELCGGTHLHQTEDLIDVVVVSLRARNQSIKEVSYHTTIADRPEVCQPSPVFSNYSLLPYRAKKRQNRVTLVSAHFSK